MAADPGEGLRAVTYYCHIMASGRHPSVQLFVPGCSRDTWIWLISGIIHGELEYKRKSSFGYCLDRHIFELMFMALISGT